MALDVSNNVRVDLQEIFDSCERTTRYHSSILERDGMNQEIVICGDDYALIWPWANEAAVLIADECNYITSTSQTGLDAISNPTPDGQVNPNDAKDVQDLTQAEKQTGEYLSKEVMDTLEFNVTQMAGFTPLDYNVTQTQIRAAIIEYVLYKWYDLCKLNDEMQKKWRQFEYWTNKLKNNSLNMQKTYKVRKPYRLF